jgi:hypothetical protein
MVAQAIRRSLVFGVVGVVWYAMEHPGKCFLVKLGPRNAGLANSTKHKPSNGGTAGGSGKRDQEVKAVVVEEQVKCSVAAVRCGGCPRVRCRKQLDKMLGRVTLRLFPRELT